MEEAHNFLESHIKMKYSFESKVWICIYTPFSFKNEKLL